MTGKPVAEPVARLGGSSGRATAPLPARYPSLPYWLVRFRTKVAREATPSEASRGASRGVSRGSSRVRYLRSLKGSPHAATPGNDPRNVACVRLVSPPLESGADVRPLSHPCPPVLPANVRRVSADCPPVLPPLSAPMSGAEPTNHQRKATQ